MARKIHSIVLKLVGHCNINCKYCYIYNHQDHSYRDRPALMATETLQALVRRINQYCDGIESHRMGIVFHGGEPTLLGARRLGEFAGILQDGLGSRLKSLAIQTNATLLDEEWVETFRRQNISVGVSLDGPPEIHDRFRVDHHGRGTQARTIAGIRQLQGAGFDPGVLTVINPGQDGLAVYRYFRELGLRWMDFLLPDVSHDSVEELYGHFGPTPVADYLLPILDAWMQEDDKTVEIRLFHDLFRRLMGGPGLMDCFGNPLLPYLVVETDGSIEAMDSLRTGSDGLGASGLNVFDHDFDDLARGRPIFAQAVHDGFPLSATCRRCDCVSVCGGGFLPHRFARANGFDNPSVWCEDIKLLLEHMGGRLSRDGFAFRPISGAAVHERPGRSPAQPAGDPRIGLRV